VIVENFSTGCLFVEKAKITLGKSYPQKLAINSKPTQIKGIVDKECLLLSKLLIDKLVLDSLYYQSMSVRISIILMEVEINEKNVSTK